MTINIECKLIHEVTALALLSDYKGGIITFDEFKEQGRQYGINVSAS